MTSDVDKTFMLVKCKFGFWARLLMLLHGTAHVTLEIPSGDENGSRSTCKASAPPLLAPPPAPAKAEFIVFRTLT